MQHAADSSSNADFSLLNELVNMRPGGVERSGSCSCGTGDDSDLHADSCGRVVIKWKWSVVPILAGATGRTLVVPAVPGTPGDHYEIQPFQGLIKARLTIMNAAATVDPLTVGFGVQSKNRNNVMPTIDGAFTTDTVPLAVVNLPFNNGIGKWVDPNNWKCIPAASATAPLQHGLFNSTGGNITVVLGLAYSDITGDVAAYDARCAQLARQV